MSLRAFRVVSLYDLDQKCATLECHLQSGRVEDQHRSRPPQGAHRGTIRRGKIGSISSSQGILEMRSPPERRHRAPMMSPVEVDRAA